jgi:hypothetical protein
MVIRIVAGWHHAFLEFLIEYVRRQTSSAFASNVDANLFAHLIEAVH